MRVGKMEKFVLELLFSSGSAPFLPAVSLPLFLLLFPFLIHSCLSMAFQGVMVLHAI